MTWVTSLEALVTRMPRGLCGAVVVVRLTGLPRLHVRAAAFVRLQAATLNDHDGLRDPGGWARGRPNPA